MKSGVLRPIAGLLLVFAGCKGSEPKPRPVPAKLAITQQPASVTAGEPFQIVVAIQDSTGATVQDATGNISLSFSTGGHVLTQAPRTLGGNLSRPAVAGVATFDNLTVDRDGGHVLGATSGQLDAAFTSVIVVNPAAAAALDIEAGDNQVTAPNGDVSIKPSVRARDVFGNGVNGVTVNFAVATGGGSVTGETQVTANGGIATVGGWTLGASGDNSLTAALAAAPSVTRTFNARVSVVFITSVSPALLVPGVVATLTGAGFSATPAQNTVTLDGAPVTVTSATPTSLTFTVPATIPCEATHRGTVHVAVGADFGSVTHPMQSARQRTLAIGDALIISDPAEVRCNELGGSAAQYLVGIFNTNRVMSLTGAQFALRGASATATGVVAAGPVTDLRRATAAEPVADPGERLHARILEENLRILEQRAPEFRHRMTQRRLQGAPGMAAAVGDVQAVRIPNVNQQNFCNEYIEVSAKVVYVGTRTIILEDVANPLAGQIDTTWAMVGQEFDAVMFNLLLDNFGDPIGTDPTTDNNGRVVMVFSKVFNDNFQGLAGFVVSCDFFPRGATSNQSSNFGEYFYARVPTVAGTIENSTENPARWRWTMRSTILHEVKHITAYGERIRAGAPFEASWLEESSARIAEELLERVNYGLMQRTNIGYGSAGDPRGPWCDVRACNGNSRGIARTFEDLNLNWYRTPGMFSPLGRRSGSDFTFYNTGWSLLRWAADHSATPEADFFKALVRGPETGLTNLEARTGRQFSDMLPEWAFANVLDDHPLVSPANPRMRQPSWDLRSVMDGLSRDFTAYNAWPFAPESRTFGSFVLTSQVFPGTAQFISIGGAQTAKQLIELRSADLGVNEGAPAELRIAIVRIQ